MLKLTINGVTLSVKYLHKAKGRQTYNYRRLVPSDLRQHYAGREIIRSLKTSDPTIAARECLRITREVEAEFLRLRSGLPKESSEGKHGLGLKLLRQFGIQPQDYDKADYEAQGDVLGFADHIEKAFESALSVEEMDALRWGRANADASRLPLAERAALETLRGEFRLKASEYPAEYLRLKDKASDQKFKNDAELAVKFLLAVLPDKAPGEYKRSELNDLIAVQRDIGLKTASIKRRLAMLRAMFNLVSLELELDEDRQHPFHDWHIPGEGEDKKDKQDFTFDQLTQLREFKASRVKEIKWMMHLMLDTGLRMKECCGLMRQDVYLDDQYPHLRVAKNPFRRLKTKNSKRFVPLVGMALEAVMEAVESGDSDWLFARYIDLEEQQTKNTSAANTMNKALKRYLGPSAPTSHSFRHTMQTRLREVGCPEHLRNELGGWSKTVSESYGSTADLKNKSEYLQKAVTTPFRNIT